MRGVFITGTDTGVGKTWFAEKLIHTLSANINNINIQPRKPVESGCINNDDILLPADAIKLQTACKEEIDLDVICNFKFAEPLAPPEAAKLHNVNLTIQSLYDACKAGICDDDFLIVEGAGGFFSPIANDGLNADLAKKLKLPVILIADDRLGAINQVLLSCKAIEQYNLKVAGIVLNSKDGASTKVLNNDYYIKQYIDANILPVSKDAICDKNILTTIIKTLIKKDA